MKNVVLILRVSGGNREEETDRVYREIRRSGMQVAEPKPGMYPLEYAIKTCALTEYLHVSCRQWIVGVFPLKEGSDVSRDNDVSAIAAAFSKGGSFDGLRMRRKVDDKYAVSNIIQGGTCVYISSTAVWTFSPVRRIPEGVQFEQCVEAVGDALLTAIKKAAPNMLASNVIDDHSQLLEQSTFESFLLAKTLDFH